MRRTAPAVLALLVCAPAFADERPSTPATRISGDVRIDGIMDEPEWARATPITGFRLIYDRQGAMPAESTEVRILFDDESIYLGFWCGNRAPGPIHSSLAPRDQILDDDHIAVHFDTYRDRRRAYIFGVNADGVQLDGILDGGDADFSWDAVWHSEAKRVMGGWVAEIAIPLSNLRFPNGGGGAWGIWFRRQIMKVDEVCSWPLWQQENQGAVMLQAAELTGLDGMRGSGGLEVQPYALFVQEQSRSFFPPPFGNYEASRWYSEADGHAGVDLRYGLTSTLTLNGTFNPDYSQVEADAVQVETNRRFALFYPEKRPFFLEGAEIFDTPLDLVYTRRIADPDAGLKLTGKQGAIGLGVIAAYDAGEGSLAGTGAGPNGGVSRDGFVGIARTTYDIGDDDRLGLLITDRRSRNEQSGYLPGLVGSGPYSQGGANTVVSGDVKWRLAQPLFFEGQLAWSRTRTDSSSDVSGTNIVASHTYEDVGYDATLRYADGVREAYAYQKYLGPDFRTETGFLERVDVRQSGIESNFYVRPENAWLRSWQPILDGYVIHDHTGGLQEWWVSPMIDWQFQKSNHAHTMYVRSMETFLGRSFDLDTWIFKYDNYLLRQAQVGVGVVVGDGIYYDAPTPADVFRGWSEEYTLEATLRPSARLKSDVGVTRARFTHDGAEVYDVWVLGANTTYQFTRRLYARVYPQYETFEKHLDADVLLGYVVHPGTVLYLGYNGDFDRIGDRTRGTHRSFFVKASYRFMR